MLNVMDLCSGIGGISLGLRRAGGFRAVCYCERDPIVSGYWATPNTVDAAGGRRLGVGQVQLCHQVKLWPTPTVPNGGRSIPPGSSPTGTTPEGKRRQIDLAQAVRLRQVFPSPMARDGKAGARKPDGERGISLVELAASGGILEWPSLLPTMTVNNARNNAGPSQRASSSPSLDVVAGGKLNPEWVELLMGYPPGWTETPPIAKSSRPRRQRRTRGGRDGKTARPESSSDAGNDEPGFQDWGMPSFRRLSSTWDAASLTSIESILE